MSRIPLHGLGVAAAIMAVGCIDQSSQDELQTIREYFPEAELSADRLDFGDLEWEETATRQFVLSNTGELPMGVEAIFVMEDDGYGENFSLSYSASDLVCPEGEEDEEDGDGLLSKGVTADTASDTGGGGGSDDGGDDGSTGSDSGDTGTQDTDEGGFLIINGGCSLPIDVTFSPVMVGQIYGSIEVDLVTEENPDPEDSEFEPAYWRDPDEFKKKIILEGTAERGQGNIVVTPLSVDMGHLWTGETSNRYVYVYNVGDGDLAILDPVLHDDCDEGFVLDLEHYDSPNGTETDGILPAGTSTLFEVLFTPEDTDTKKCELTVGSEDEDTPEIEVKLQGNSGVDPDNVPPTCSITSPQPGYVHTTGDPLVVKMNIFDTNQPASSLLCQVRSAILLEGTYVRCTATDESGYVEVEIPVEDLEEGIDTLQVRVTDQSEQRCTASTTILFKESYPASDDDGDGFGEDTIPADCDDTDITVYPEAAEVYDGRDNDCDGGIDEYTEGSDDDGDSVTELEGDCDDNEGATYPGAQEIADQKDNDCNGIVDDHTSLYDDDGDGFAEVDLDCNDDDPAINPAAIEYCDGIDNDCNGLKDQQEDCVSFESEPSLIGDVKMEYTAIGQGESVVMSIFPFDPDGQDISCEWAEDTDLVSRGHTAIDSPTAYSINWKAPNDLDEDSPGEVYAVYVVCEDEDGNQDWAFDEILVYPEPVLPYQEDIIQPEDGGCGAVTDGYAGARGVPAAESLLVIPGIGLFVAARRFRRREDEE